ncbi:MAG: hypothetical protein N3D16_05650 [Anaerolineales bacterium]|nr:hypothetical protein [Anaerolineales bacterium]
MSSISDVHQMIERLSNLNKEVYSILQDPIFDSLAFTKVQGLLDKLQGNDFTRIRSVFLGEHLRKSMPINLEREYFYLSEDFLNSLPRVPKNSVFLLTNNDIGSSLPKYIDFYNSNPGILFIIWDWDSQHWIAMSSMLAVYSDFYIAAGSENAFLLSHFNPNVIGPVFCAVHQWTRRFIVDNIDCILGSRSDSPLGKHVYYSAYPKRNRVIASVAVHYPDVGFSDNQYKSKSDIDNLREWASYKVHWISPVLSGVPIRVYNSLITGGIPLLPSFTRNMPEVEILGKYPLYYGVEDLLNPKKIVNDAVNRFDLGGESGLIERVSCAIEKHHVDGRWELILSEVEKQIDKINRSDRGFQSGYLGIRPFLNN